MTHNQNPMGPRNRGEVGFTLAEVLLAGTLGSLLLMALAASTLTFTETLHDLEEKAGIAVDENAVLGTLTRDIREAWTATVPASNRLKLFDSDGNVTLWYLEGKNVKVIKPDGDTDAVIENVDSILFEPSHEDRRREGDVATNDATWYSKGALASPNAPLVLGKNDDVALAFTVPIDDTAIGASGDEQILSAQAGVIAIALARGNDDGTAGSLSIELYETLGPGSGVPVGSALGAVSLVSTLLPEAVDDGSGNWLAPTTDLPISLSSMGVQLEPGAGYAIVMNLGNGELVLNSHMIFGAGDDDDTAVALNHGAFAVQARRVPFSLSGSVDSTTTILSQEITRISITLVPDGRPVQTRSAALLNQVLSDDPWLGSVAGEEAPGGGSVGSGVGGGGGVAHGL